MSRPTPPDPPSGFALSPPVVQPESFEDFPAFRETFLLLFTDATANASMRGFGKLLHELVLEFWGYWPDHPEGIFKASLRAALADLRHVQGSLAEWTGPDAVLETAQDEHLARLVSDVALSLGSLADGLEQELEKL